MRLSWLGRRARLRALADSARRDDNLSRYAHGLRMVRGPTITQLNEIRALARRLGVLVTTVKTADEADRQLAALKAYAEDG